MEARRIRALLAEHEFFRGLDEASLDFIAGCGRNVRFEAGATIFREGEPADLFYVVRAGRVALEIQAPGRGPLTVDTVGEGDILGASWLFPPYRWTFDARALEPTRAVGLDARCLRDKCDEDVRLGYALTTRMAGVLRRRMQSARVRLLDIYGHGRAG